MAKRDRKPLSEEEHQRRREAVIRLREEGRSNGEIRKTLGKAGSDAIISELIKDGVLKDGRTGSWHTPEAEDERQRIIVDLKKQHATLEEIGASLGGLTRERARQLVNDVAAEHGEDVFISDEPLWTTKEAAEELGVSNDWISQLCRKGEIPCRQRSLINEYSPYILTQESMDALKRHPYVTGERKCVTCGAACFVKPKIVGRWDIRCSNCRKESSVERTRKLCEKTPTPDNLSQWHRTLWRRLQCHRKPKGEQWLILSEAREMIGLSSMQVIYLGHRGIITTDKHPTKRWKGRPITTYAASEVKIAGQVYRQHQQENGQQ